MLDAAQMTTIIVALIAGGFGIGLKSLFDYIQGKRKGELGLYGDLKKLIEETLASNAALSDKNTNQGQEITTLKMMVEVSNGTISKNNEFMKDVLIGWGEMKKSEELCQKRLAEFEMRIKQLETAGAV